MVVNTTFNNISVISWRSVLLMDETRVHSENHWPVTSHWQILFNPLMTWFLVYMCTYHLELWINCFHRICFIFTGRKWNYYMQFVFNRWWWNKTDVGFPVSDSSVWQLFNTQVWFYDLEFFLNLITDLQRNYASCGLWNEVKLT